MDPKGRIVLPARMKGRLPIASEQRIFIVLGYKKYLTIYTSDEWDEKLQAFAAIPDYDEEGQQFIRDFTAGMAEEVLDSQGRFTLNKFLISYAGLSSDVVLTAQGSRIEIWDAEEYRKNLTPVEKRPGLQSTAKDIFSRYGKSNPQNPA